MSRVRSAAQRAPQTLEAATALAERFASVTAEIGVIEADRKASVAATNATADGLVVPLIAEAKDIAKQLQPWWAANMDELTGGKRKSIELGGCVIGYRVSPPKLAFEHGKDQDLVEALSYFGREAQLRTTIAPNKPVILAELAGEPDADAVPLELIGLSATQSEDFFLDLAGSDAAKVSAQATAL